MQAAQKRGLGINVGFLVPLTPLRHFVLGEESSERAARPDERERIKGLLSEALDAGALGFSTTVFRQHLGYKARPLACRLADRDELAAYAGVLKSAGKGVVEIALTQDLGLLSEQEYDLLDLLLRESQRPVTWTALLPRITDLKAHEATLRKAEPLIRRGGVPQISGKGNKILFALRDPFVFAPRAEWKPVFHRERRNPNQAAVRPRIPRDICRRAQETRGILFRQLERDVGRRGPQSETQGISTARASRRLRRNWAKLRLTRSWTWRSRTSWRPGSAFSRILNAPDRAADRRSHPGRDWATAARTSICSAAPPTAPIC